MALPLAFTLTSSWWEIHRDLEILELEREEEFTLLHTTTLKLNGNWSRWEGGKREQKGGRLINRGLYNNIECRNHNCQKRKQQQQRQQEPQPQQRATKLANAANNPSLPPSPLETLNPRQSRK